MYIKDGIAYSDNEPNMLDVMSVCPMEGYHLKLAFSDGSKKVFSFTELLEGPAFQPLKDMRLFESAYIDHGTVVWDHGTIDISTDYLYSHSTPCDGE